MKHVKLFIAVLIGVAIVSCKKEEGSQVTGGGAPTYKYFTQLKVGNYWVYSQYKKSIYTGEISDQSTDSVYISKDTTINGNVYYKQEGTNSLLIGGAYYQFLRDSSGYIVDEYGIISEYKIVNYTDTVLKQNYPDSGTVLYHASAKWSDENISKTTPAGTFTTSNFKLTLTLLDPPGLPDVYVNNYFAYDVGLVKSDGPDITDPLYSRIRELKKYHLN